MRARMRMRMKTRVSVIYRLWSGERLYAAKPASPAEVRKLFILDNFRNPGPGAFFRSGSGYMYHLLCRRLCSGSRGSFWRQGPSGNIVIADQSDLLRQWQGKSDLFVQRGSGFS